MLALLSTVEDAEESGTAISPRLYPCETALAASREVQPFMPSWPAETKALCSDSSFAPRPTLICWSIASATSASEMPTAASTPQVFTSAVAPMSVAA